MLTIHPPGAMRFETVGGVIPETELRIEGAAEGNAEGEVLARGPGVFAGYHALPQKTAEAFTADGWFRTGDLGRIDETGWLRLTGRRSTVIVTEGGKNLQPEEIEIWRRQRARSGIAGLRLRDTIASTRENRP